MTISYRDPQNRTWLVRNVQLSRVPGFLTGLREDGLTVNIYCSRANVRIVEEQKQANQQTK